MSGILNWNRAATSADPAPGVEEALLEGLHAADPARGAGIASARREQIRASAARLFGWSHPDRVVFTSGATFGLNQAVHAVRSGAFVLATELEHNAALRPLEVARCDGRFELGFLPFNAHGQVTVDAVAKAMAPHSGCERWLFLALASNVLGTLQPTAEIAAWCHKNQVHLVLDLSQGGGQVPIPLDAWAPTFATVAGHKGLHGPQGVGLLFVGLNAPLRPLLSGGTGRYGEKLTPPIELPGCLEVGTPNMPGIYALGAAIEWRLQQEAQLDAVRAALASVEEELRKDPRVQVLPKEAPPWEERLPVLSFACSGLPSEVLAAQLAQDGILVRSGMMCAAFAAPSAGINDLGGVVRLSPPEYATQTDANRVISAIRKAIELFIPTA
ncbi:MAG: aminotransferase class V-fold PLP-dependent enzyme [Planctomycetes bacterium]|nr:aminotransferase class V-fold PLP-dependent enzyme [Planctomycetota bacterium]